MFGYSDIIIKKKQNDKRNIRQLMKLCFHLKKMKSTWLDSLMIFDAYVYSQKKI